MPETQPLKQFSWIGRDAAGQVAQGQIEAAGEAAARVLLRQRGIQAITLQSPRPVREARRSRVRRRDIAFFTRQLGTLLKAGIPLLPALRVIGRGHDNPGFARLIGQIHDDIASGCGLADAFLRHPKHFDTLYCHMLAAGEQGGILDDMLEQLATDFKARPLTVDLAVPANAAPLGFRPEDADVAADGDAPAGSLVLPATVEAVEPVGAESFLYCGAAGGRIVVRVSGRATAQPGDALRVVAKADRLHWFDSAGKRV